MKKKWNIIYIVCFLIILIIPLVLTNTATDVASDLDNRMLTEMPRIGNEDFNQNLEAYLEDRIGLRTEMITAYEVVHDIAADELIHPSYMYGKEKYVFVDLRNNIQYGEYHRRFAQKVLSLQKYCEARGARFYFMFEPEKASVYRQYLPEGVHYDDSWADIMLDNMRDIGIHVVDNKTLLCELGKTQNVFNRKYDAYHWNDIGCFYATNNLLKQIHQDIPEVQEIAAPDFEEGTAQYLPQSRFIINETIPVFRLAENGEDITFVGEDLTDQYITQVKTHPRYPYFKYYRNLQNNAETLPKMLAFVGSYYNEGERDKRFLAGKCFEMMAVHNYQNVLDLNYYFDLFKPDVVVFEVAEYTLFNEFFNLPETIITKSLYSSGYVSQDNEKNSFRYESPGQDNQFNAVAFQVIDMKTGETTTYAFQELEGEYSGGFNHTAESGWYILRLTANGTSHDEYVESYAWLENGEDYYLSFTVDRLSANEIDVTGYRVVGYSPKLNATAAVPLSEMRTSGCVTDEEDKTFTIGTQTEGNEFFELVVEQKCSDEEEYHPIRLINTAQKVSLLCNLNTEQTNMIRIRANSSLQDEYIAFSIPPTGETLLRLDFNVDSFSAREIVIRNLNAAVPE